jgi:hypothetical protein
VKGETLKNYPGCDSEIARLGDELWGGKIGSGRVIADKTAREVLAGDGVPPDYEFLPTVNPQVSTDFDYIHRTGDGAEIYFVANRLTNRGFARLRLPRRPAKRRNCGIR